MYRQTVSVNLVLCLIFSANGMINNVYHTKHLLPLHVKPSQNLLRSMNQGVELALQQCQRIFMWDLWNCPAATFNHQQQQFGATKEQAFVDAITAAAVLHTLTRNCSRGELAACGCDPRYGSQQPINVPGLDITQEVINRTHFEWSGGERVSWSWGGCSDRMEFGDRIARDYLHGGDDAQSLMQVHNNQIGREVVKQSITKRCRCHGVSGSCTLQTCWMQIAPFVQIAQTLRDKYDKALQVDVNNQPDTSLNRPQHTNNLIFLEQSPNYCVVNASTLWKGAKGRTCSRTKLEAASVYERKSCRNICRACGLKVRKMKRTVTKRCNCKFNWCCEVTCDLCSETFEEYHCD